MKKIKLFEEFNSKDYINRSSISPIEEVTEDTYYDMLGAMPPIYVSTINGEKVSGFAVSEPSDTKKGLPTFGVYFEVEGKFYKTEATLMDKNGKPITYAMYNNMEMSKGNKATSIETKRPFVAESKKETTPSELQNKAIKILDDELSWNPHSIKVPDELDVASYDHIKNFKQDTGLIYFGMAGQSLSKDILKALNDNGIDAKVTRGVERTRQSDEHDYIIVLKESITESLDEAKGDWIVWGVDQNWSPIDIERKDRPLPEKATELARFRVPAGMGFVVRSEQESKVEEKSGDNRNTSKMKEIMNNIRNIMMLKPDMPFVTVMYNALDSTDFGAFDDEDVLTKLQNYEKFLRENK